MSEIAKNAEIILELLQEKQGIEFSQLKEESKLIDVEFWAAIGWLSYERKLDCIHERNNGKTKIIFTLME